MNDKRAFLGKLLLARVPSAKNDVPSSKIDVPSPKNDVPWAKNDVLSNIDEFWLLRQEPITKPTSTRG